LVRGNEGIRLLEDDLLHGAASFAVRLERVSNLFDCCVRRLDGNG
jgi:hypothetical protein